MSFGDFSKSGRAPQRTKLSPTQLTIAEDEEEELSSGGLAKISDGILQYQVRQTQTVVSDSDIFHVVPPLSPLCRQRNLGILERIVRQVGTPSDGPVLEQQ
jgi:hypothetical protein